MRFVSEQGVIVILHGLVAKTIFPELPPRSEYRITEPGSTLLPIIDAMLRWGEEHFEVFEKKYR